MSSDRSDTEAAQGRTHAIVFCDTVGTTKLMASEGDLVVVAVFREFFENVGRLAQQYHCVFMKFLGDGFFATFEQVAETAPFVAAVRQLGDRLEALKGRRLLFTFGVVVGDVFYVETSYGGDALGAAINVAAHLERSARADQLVASSTALDRLPPEWRRLAGPREETRMKDGRDIAFHRIDLTARFESYGAGNRLRLG